MSREQKISRIEVTAMELTDLRRKSAEILEQIRLTESHLAWLCEGIEDDDDLQKDRT